MHLAHLAVTREQHERTPAGDLEDALNLARCALGEFSRPRLRHAVRKVEQGLPSKVKVARDHTLVGGVEA